MPFVKLKLALNDQIIKVSFYIQIECSPRSKERVVQNSFNKLETIHLQISLSNHWLLYIYIN